MSEPKHEPDEWQHVPTVVNVVRDGRKRAAEVKTHQQWSILDAEHCKIVPWRLMVVLPPELEPYPLVFESRGEARRWAETNDAVREFGWSPLEGPQRPSPGEPTHHSLTLYSGPDGTMLDTTDPPYVVLATYGVADWGQKQPSGANVPNWMPKSFRTSGRSDLHGHNYGEPRRQHCLLLATNEALLWNVPWPMLDSAFTN